MSMQMPTQFKTVMALKCKACMIFCVTITRKPSYRWQTRATRKPAKISPIRRAYNVVADNTGLSSCV